MPVKIQMRRGTATEWTSANPVLLSGEVGVETDTNKTKIGTGTASWVNLPYQDDKFLSNSQGQPAVQFGAAGSVLDNIPSRVHPAEQLLKQAVWWIDSAHSSADGQSIQNLGWGGSALAAQAGSTTGADSNDPKYLDWTGENYVYLPGVAGNYLSVPDEAALDITGDIDIRVRVALDDWTPAADGRLLSKNANANQSYELLMGNDGKFYFYWTTDGSTTKYAASGVNTVTDGTVKWVRVTMDVDNGAGGYDAKFELSDDGTTWTQLGSTVTGTGVTSIFSGSAPLAIGATPSGASTTTAKVYRAQILNGINGTPVLDIDTSVIASGAATSFTARTGQTVTINRSTSGRKAVAVVHPVWLFGTDDYLEVPARWVDHTGTNYVYLPGVTGNYLSTPDAAALDITGDLDLRVRVAMDDWTPGAVQMLISKLASVQASYRFWLNTNGTLTLGWSTNGSNDIQQTSSALGLTDGAVKWVRATLDVDNGAAGHDVKFWTSDDGSTWTQIGSTITTAGTTSVYAGTAPLEVGAQVGGTGTPLAGKVFRAQVYNGIGGTLVLDVDTSVIIGDPASFTATTGQTVTINRSGSTFQSYGVTQSGYLVPGNPDSFQPSSYSMLDFGASDSFTVVAVVRSWNAPSVTSGIVTKRNSSGVYSGWDLGANPTTVKAGQYGVTVFKEASIATSYGGVLKAVASVVDRVSQTITAAQNGTIGSSTSLTALTETTTNSVSMRVGAYSAGTAYYSDMEFVAAAVFRRALTATEIATLTNYYSGRVGA